MNRGPSYWSKSGLQGGARTRTMDGRGSEPTLVPSRWVRENQVSGSLWNWDSHWSLRDRHLWNTFQEAPLKSHTHTPLEVPGSTRYNIISSPSGAFTFPSSCSFSLLSSCVKGCLSPLYSGALCCLFQLGPRCVLLIPEILILLPSSPRSQMFSYI